MYDASNMKDSRARIVLVALENILLEQSLRFEFKASNNQAKYEGIVVGMKLSINMDASSSNARSNSQLIAN